MYVAFTRRRHHRVGHDDGDVSFPGISPGSSTSSPLTTAATRPVGSIVVGPGVVNAAATQVTFTTNLGVTLVAGGLYAFMVYTPASIVTPSPSPTPPRRRRRRPRARPRRRPTPTPTPTATPVRGGLAGVRDFGATTDPAQSVIVTESGYTGGFAQTNTCGSGSTAIAV